ncbi:WxL domain-containing protein [Enterococcus sp. AD013-P3]|uniref:WxL domain-containing protein n=1 Tax=Enterococcus sp. AD013-P3 TaxID=3411036 RepID=UPI003B93EFE1
MKKYRAIVALLLASCSFALFKHHSFAAEGSTSLEILPLKEEYPRVYEVSDLDFGDHFLKESGQQLHPKNDLTIKILDSRETSSSWELQVQLAPLKNETNEELAMTSISIGKGKVEMQEGFNIQGVAVNQILDEATFQTILRSESASSHGWVTYSVAKEDISISLGQINKSGSYQATNNWRFINAKL